MHKKHFVKSHLANCLSLALSTAVVLPLATQAQEQQQDIEVIEITGIRSSLIKSMDIKRGSNGVVDAITAEDIGKMPDANLAESLQRITGVSIDRSGGEGSKITVRGFGPEFNLVTLNGRQMPTTGGRSFDFADIATEGVSGVEVYKTADASKPSGGIGATVNITTAKPLSSPGLKASVGGKAVHSDMVEEGDDWTPELSFLLSNTFADNTFGVFLSGSYQEYHSRSEGAAVDKWFPSDFGESGDYAFTPIGIQDAIANGDYIDNNTKDIYWYPQNAGYNYADFERERTNGQAVIQYAPTTELTFTVDYTYSKVERYQEGAGFGVWFGSWPVVEGEINENGTFVRTSERGGDYATNLNRTESERENKSLGINIEWAATDTITFELDYHTSEATDEGQNLGQDAYLIIGNTSCDWCGEDMGGPTANIDVKSAAYNVGELPIWDISFIDGAGNPQSALKGSDIGSLFGASVLNAEENEMDQLQFHGDWINESDSALTEISFGFAWTEMDFRSTNRFSEQLAAGFWLWSAMHYDDSAFEFRPTGGMLDEFDNGGNFPVDYFTWADFDYIVDRFENIDDPHGANEWGYSGAWPSELGGQFGPGPIDNDHRINEETYSAYVQFNFETEFNDFPMTFVLGLRYEKTDVEAASLEKLPTHLVWIAGTEWSHYLGDESFSEGTGDTDEFLPNFDMSMDITDDIIGRFSYSRTMTRPNIGALRAASSYAVSPKVGQRRLAVGNPALQPFVSDNVDLSLEWYYEEGSYASAGYFRKNVDNFIVNRTTQEESDFLYDAYLGDCAEEARANGATSDNEVYDAMIALGCGSASSANDIVSGESTDPNGEGWTDPLAIYDVSRDYNEQDGSLWGWELAAQHMFGTTGFGLSANATLVYGDIEADREVIGYQFALPGLSDSANVSFIYDDGETLSARLSMNWRDEFLTGFDGDNSPVFTESYTQWDINVNYSVTENFTVFVEGLNITEETLRTYTRYSEQFLSASQFGARYNIGARYTF